MISDQKILLKKGLFKENDCQFLLLIVKYRHGNRFHKRKLLSCYNIFKSFLINLQCKLSSQHNFGIGQPNIINCLLVSLIHLPDLLKLCMSECHIYNLLNCMPKLLNGRCIIRKPVSIIHLPVSLNCLPG